MKFLADENIRLEVVEFLKKRGFDVKLVPKGSSNGDVASLAKREKRVLLTHDADFANKSLYPPEEFFGIVIFRIHPPVLEKLISSLEKFLATIEPKELTGKLFFLEET